VCYVSGKSDESDDDLNHDVGDDAGGGSDRQMHDLPPSVLQNGDDRDNEDDGNNMEEGDHDD
jgi:hypothetical protein